MKAIRCAVTLLGLTAAFVAGQPISVPNASFEQGSGEAPTGWKPSVGCEWGRGEGAEGSRFVTVKNDGGSRENAVWESDTIPFKPDTVYELRLRYRYRPEMLFTPGNLNLGTAFAMRTLPVASQEALPRWENASLRFVTPSVLDEKSSKFHLGQWVTTGAIDFDALELYPVQVAHRAQGALSLGEGERIFGNRYAFNAPFSTWAGISRPLVSFRGKFHDNRWRFHEPGDQVVYRHALAGRRQLGGTLSLTSSFHAESSWSLAIEASVDGVHWRLLGKAARGVAPGDMVLPKDFFPASAVWIRLRNETSNNAKPVFHQLTGYQYTGEVDGAPENLTGTSSFVTVLGTDPGVEVSVSSGDDRRRFSVSVQNTGASAVSLNPVLLVRHEKGGEQRLVGRPVDLAPKGVAKIDLDFEALQAGSYQLDFSLGPKWKTRLSSVRDFTIIESTQFGQLLESPSTDIDLWWASSGWKVSADRLPPKAGGVTHATRTKPAVSIRLAGGEAEAAQVVLRSRQNLSGLTVEASPLVGPGGVTLPASALEIFRVRYVPVEIQSDRLGSTGLWPDPLPPILAPLSLEAGVNQPLWVRISAPRGAHPGRYSATLRLSAKGFQAEVPLSVEVFAFTLPEKPTCETAFGMNPGNIFRYHQLQTEADKRTVLDKYMKSFASHRVAPYQPVPLDPLRWEWPKTSLPWEGGRRVEGGAKGSRGAWLLEDARETENARASYTGSIKIGSAPLMLSCWYRTSSNGIPASAYFGFYDAAGKHISGKNAALVLPPSTEWRRIELTFTKFPEGAASARLWFHAIPYHEKGVGTGSLWLDEVSVKVGEQELIASGDFEHKDQAAVGKPVFQWANWDAAMERAFSNYGFNTFKFDIPGLGGGTFQSRTEPSLLGFSENQPEYRQLLSAWCSEARNHLIAKGWLDKAYIYPFDEPAEKDYPFVRNQAAKVKEFFPGLRRMVPLNLGTADPLVGALDVWCPILSSHNPVWKQKREAVGEQYWWYICTGPRAPYIASFIDRPATDMRVWLWQTWQEKVRGILIWESTYWNSAAAYPDSLQNPYEDSMSWNSSLKYGQGVKRPWAAGDGRFLYPPEAATGKQGRPVLDGPVDSIRWEMLRDGLEDYEYFTLLKTALAQRGASLPASEREAFEKLLSVPPEVSMGLTAYTTDPAPLEARRELLARAIERLSK